MTTTDPINCESMWDGRITKSQTFCSRCSVAKSESDVEMFQPVPSSSVDVLLLQNVTLFKLRPNFAGIEKEIKHLAPYFNPPYLVPKSSRKNSKSLVSLSFESLMSFFPNIRKVRAKTPS